MLEGECRHSQAEAAEVAVGRVCAESPADDATANESSATWWPRASLVDRLVQLALAGAAWVVLLLAISLEPASDGLGTHEQLGLAPCTFHALTGKPCPGCGLTTAFTHMAHGQVVDAVIVQPFGAVLFVLTALGAIGLAVTGVLGRSWNLVLYRINVPVWLYGLIVLWLAAWLFKMAWGAATGSYGP